MQTRPRRRTAWLIALGVLIALAAVGAFLARDLLRVAMYRVTGEEDLREQIKGTVAWALIQLTRPPLQTAPMTPIAHAGVNPYGVNTFLEQEVEPAKVEQAIRMIREAGFHWIRQEFPWEDIEIHGKGDFTDRRNEPPRSAWEKYDRIVDLAERYGLEIIARLDNPPAWSRADGDARGTLAPPDNLDDFGDFVEAVVTRYKGRIRYYQIWNEPNIYPEWGEQPVDPEGYVALLKVAYARAKAADPDCVILCAGLAQTLEPGGRNMSDLVFLQRMYDAGVRGYFDIMGVMAYGLWTGPTDRRATPDRTNFARPQLIREIMVRNGDADKPIWATEVGWNAVPPDFPKPAIYGRVTPEQQARYAVEAYRRAQAEWPWMGVMNYWFFKRATDTETGEVFYYFRMVEPDFTPMPVYEAMRQLTAEGPKVYAGWHQEDHWALAYSGRWVDVADSRAVLGRYRRSEGEGQVRFRFVGTGLDLAVVKGPNAGAIRVFVDGREAEVVNLHAEADMPAAIVPVAHNLQSGEHEAAIYATDGAGLDGLIVTNRPGTYAARKALGLAAVAVAALGLLSVPFQMRRRR
ncbi:MAG: hypothetical protein Kow00123_24980 [Anaerolineales bacterium]